MRRRITASPLVLAVVVPALVASGCGSDTSGSASGSAPRSGAASATASRAVTAAEADRLAVSRFLLYQGTGARVTATLPSSQGPLELEADVDFATHIGFGRVTGAGSSFVVEWDGDTFLAWPGGASAALPTALPSTAPSSRSLTPTKVVTDALFSLLLQLGANRPDNAQLLRQGGATWLRRTTIGSTKVDVLAGPQATGSASGGQSLRYYIDARGNLLRVLAQLGGAQNSPTTIDLDPSRFHAVPVATQLSR